MYLNIYQFSEPDASGSYYQPLTHVAICDTFTSLIWDVEYYECGAFEVYIGASPESVRIFRKGRVVGRSDDTKNYGIIKQVKLETDAENGDYLTVKGRFLMSLLERRIIYPAMTFTAMRTYGEIVQTAVRKNCIKVWVSSSERVIPSLELGTVSGNCWEIRNVLQVSYENLMQWIYTICKLVGGTANITLVPYEVGTDDGRFKLQFDLSEGVDRSVTQSERAAIVFSDAYDNLINYTYETDSTEYTNFAYAFGQGTGSKRKQATYYTGNSEPQRLDRYELYVDANDIADTENDNGTETEIPEEQYRQLLISRAAEKLTEIKTSSAATIASDGRQYQYGIDYAVGDYVTVENTRFGLVTEKIQLIGMIESFDKDGYSLTPVMQTLEG